MQSHRCHAAIFRFAVVPWSKMNLLFRILVEKNFTNTKNYMISKHIIAHFYYFYVPEERQRKI